MGLLFASKVIFLRKGALTHLRLEIHGSNNQTRTLLGDSYSAMMAGINSTEKESSLRCFELYALAGMRLYQRDMLRNHDQNR